MSTPLFSAATYLLQTPGRKLLVFVRWYSWLAQRGLRKEIVGVDRIPLSVASMSARELLEFNG